MNISSRSTRLTALLTAFLAALVLLSITLSSGDTPGALAASNLTGTSCSDIFLDRGTVAAGEPNGVVDADDIWIGSAIARIEDPGGAGTHPVDVTSVLYLGPDLVLKDSEDYNADTVPDASAIADLVPDGPPVQVHCQAANTAAGGAAESGDMHNRTNFAVTGEGVRPNFSGTYNPVAGTLTYGTCDFSEALGAWIRQESTIDVDKGVGKSEGAATLFLGTSAPAAQSPPGHATDYTTCLTPGSLSFPSVLRSDERDPATDGTPVAPVVADPNGAGVVDSADGLADDWDGDGCTDWDELDDYASLDQDGNDPFNPLDCDTNVAGIGFTQVTVTANTANNGLAGIGRRRQWQRHVLPLPDRYPAERRDNHHHALLLHRQHDINRKRIRRRGG